jgi:hypothetical protein
MKVRICSVRECEKRIHARSLCKSHYWQLWTQGGVPRTDPNRLLHRITNADVSRSVGHCAVCGPKTPIRIRPGRGHECMNRRKQDEDTQRAAMYSLTVDVLERMKIDQWWRCAICQELTDQLAVDHDHSCCPTKTRSCGKCVRGLLCRNCNLALGYLRDNPDFAEAAAVYLRKQEPPTPPIDDVA